MKMKLRQKKLITTASATADGQIIKNNTKLCSMVQQISIESEIYREKSIFFLIMLFAFRGRVRNCH